MAVIDRRSNSAHKAVQVPFRGANFFFLFLPVQHHAVIFDLETLYCTWYQSLQHSEYARQTHAHVSAHAAVVFYFLVPFVLLFLWDVVERPRGTEIRLPPYTRMCCCCATLLPQAKLTDGREFAATIVGTDPSTDIAVLRLNSGGGVPIVPMGDSSKLRVGQVLQY